MTATPIQSAFHTNRSLLKHVCYQESFVTGTVSGYHHPGRVPFFRNHHSGGAIIHAMIIINAVIALQDQSMFIIQSRPFACLFILHNT